MQRCWGPSPVYDYSPWKEKKRPVLTSSCRVLENDGGLKTPFTILKISTQYTDKVCRPDSLPLLSFRSKITSSNLLVLRCEIFMFVTQTRRTVQQNKGLTFQLNTWVLEVVGLRFGKNGLMRFQKWPIHNLDLCTDRNYAYHHQFNWIRSEHLRGLSKFWTLLNLILSYFLEC